MRRSFLMLMFVMTPILASADTTPDISGEWARADGKTRVNIASCGAQLCVTNTWVRDPDSDESVGDRLVMTLSPEGNARLAGTAFDAKRNASYSMQISVDRDHMRTQGCVIAGVVCKTMDWTRVQ